MRNDFTQNKFAEATQNQNSSAIKCCQRMFRTKSVIVSHVSECCLLLKWKKKGMKGITIEFQEYKFSRILPVKNL